LQEKFAQDQCKGKPIDMQPKDRQKEMHAFWGCDPRQSAAACTTAVYRLRLPEDADIKQLAPVVAEAKKRGWVVYDDDCGMCFLPDGTIFPESMREVWEWDLAELMAGPEDPNNKKPDNRTLLQTIAGELFDAIGRGEKRIY